MSIGKSSIKRAIAGSTNEAPASVKEAGKPAEKKTEEKKMAEDKTMTVKKTAGRSQTVAKKTTAKKPAVAAKSVIAGTNEQVLSAISKREGLNDHFGLNTPLPTFLL
ncbi:MAG: hypothetical protein IJT63_01745 [Lachnospiraceae bacterium]|nr:hypothetical protein [Lachnospiraceae bacterium]